MTKFKLLMLLIPTLTSVKGMKQRHLSQQPAGTPVTKLQWAPYPQSNVYSVPTSTGTPSPSYSVRSISPLASPSPSLHYSPRQGAPVVGSPIGQVSPTTPRYTQYVQQPLPTQHLSPRVQQQRSHAQRQHVQRAVAVTHSDVELKRDLFVQLDENDHVIQGNKYFVEGKKSIGYWRSGDKHECEQKLQLVNGRWTALHPLTKEPLSGVKLYKAAKARLFDWMTVTKNVWRVKMKYIQSIITNPIEGIKLNLKTLSTDEIQLYYSGVMGESARPRDGFFEDVFGGLYYGPSADWTYCENAWATFSIREKGKSVQVSGRQLEPLFSKQE